MKKANTKSIVHAAICIFLSGILLMCGCESLRPIEPQPPAPPAKQTAQNDFVITYNYGDTDKVQLSANNIALKTGQKLVLQPAPGLTKNTRFLSSGENFIGDIMQQEPNQNDPGKVIFTAVKPGKGKLQIIPNGTETDRATDLWVTVQ